MLLDALLLSLAWGVIELIAFLCMYLFLIVLQNSDVVWVSLSVGALAIPVAWISYRFLFSRFIQKTTLLLPDLTTGLFLWGISALGFLWALMNPLGLWLSQFGLIGWGLTGFGGTLFISSTLLTVYNFIAPRILDPQQESHSTLILKKYLLMWSKGHPVPRLWPGLIIYFAVYETVFTLFQMGFLVALLPPERQTDPVWISLTSGAWFIAGALAAVLSFPVLLPAVRKP